MILAIFLPVTGESTFTVAYYIFLLKGLNTDKICPIFVTGVLGGRCVPVLFLFPPIKGKKKGGSLKGF